MDGGICLVLFGSRVAVLVLADSALLTQRQESEEWVSGPSCSSISIVLAIFVAPFTLTPHSAANLFHGDEACESSWALKYNILCVHSLRTFVGDTATRHNHPYREHGGLVAAAIAITATTTLICLNTSTRIA